MTDQMAYRRPDGSTRPDAMEIGRSSQPLEDPKLAAALVLARDWIQVWTGVESTRAAVAARKALVAFLRAVPRETEDALVHGAAIRGSSVAEHLANLVERVAIPE